MPKDDELAKLKKELARSRAEIATLQRKLQAFILKRKSPSSPRPRANNS